jgi:SAM-dependent methyltransferase
MRLSRVEFVAMNNPIRRWIQKRIEFRFLKKFLERYKEARFFVGDVTEIKSPSNKYDAVFVFGILHHVPEWKVALREIYRVLKPKGVLLIEEVNRSGVDFVEKYLHFSHPKESRFDWPQFAEELKKVGFDIVEESKIILSIFHVYFCMKPIANGR